MKEFDDNDYFKDGLKIKMDDSPVYKNHEEELWSKLIEKIETKEGKRKKKRSMVWYVSAASILIGLSTGIFYWNDKSDNIQLTKHTDKIELRDSTKKVFVAQDHLEQNIGKPPVDTISKNEINASNSSIQEPLIFKAKKKITEYNLPDGSHLTLNKNAFVKLDADFKNNRSLTSYGEVYFEIKPDKAKPFNVYFETHRLVVVGTKFNIRNISFKQNSEVTVTEGIVMVFPENKGKGIKVKAGEHMKLIQNKKPSLVKVNAYNFISWKTGMLDFNNASMEEVTQLMSRKYNRAINLNPVLKKCTFTGDLTQLSLDEAIEIIKITTSLKVEKRGHEIYISGEGCK